MNNDGLVDLFIAKGNVADMPDFAAADPNDLLLQGGDGKFSEVGDKAGVASMAGSRGAALPDFNLDGLPDLVVVGRGQNRAGLAQRHPECRPLARGAPAAGRVRTAMRSARGWRSRQGRTSCAGKSPSAAATPAGRSAGGTLASPMPPRPRCGFCGRTVAASDWQPVAGNNFYILERGKPARPVDGEVIAP